MSALSLVQPNLMSTEELRNHLKARFPSQDLSELPRGQLLRLYSTYATPKTQRNTSRDVEMKPSVEPNVVRENGNNKRSRHELITAPTVETVTNACKKIRLINNHTERANLHKRQHEPMESDVTSPAETKRKKITWP